MMWSFLAGMACMFVLMCVLSVWAGLHLAKKVEQRPYKHLVTALQEQDEKRRSVAPHPGACPEKTRAGAQPAATTAFARPLGATPIDADNRWIVFDRGCDDYVVGVVTAPDDRKAVGIADLVYRGWTRLQPYRNANLRDKCSADEIDEATERKVRDQYA